MARIVRDAMIGDPVTVEASTPVAEAARRLQEQQAGDAVVVDGSKPVGVVTGEHLGDGAQDDGTPVKEVCPEAAFVLRAQDPLAQAIQLMRKRDEQRLPVVEHGDVVGVVRLGDLQDELEDAAGDAG